MAQSLIQYATFELDRTPHNKIALVNARRVDNKIINPQLSLPRHVNYLIGCIRGIIILNIARYPIKSLATTFMLGSLKGLDLMHV